MIPRRLRKWFPRASSPAPGGTAGARSGTGPPTPLVPPASGTDWPSERLAIADALWGEGFSLPGGEEEVLRLAKPLGLSAACSVALLGCGAGGAARCLAERLDAWVSGFESDPALAAVAERLCSSAGLGRRAQIAVWTPTAPSLPPRYYHHALALEPLRRADPAIVLPTLAGALRTGGNLVITEIVAGDGQGGDSAHAAEWQRVERRAPPPEAQSLTRALEGLGFDIRVVEDITERHVQLTIRGWREFVRGLAATPPSPAQAAWLVREAEIWLRRAQAMRAGHARLVRWHAISRAAG